MGNRTSRNYSQCFGMQPVKTTVFKQESKNGITYRIPALIYIRDGQAFLAFAEKRTTPSDNNAETLVMRRGTLLKGSVQWSPSQELTSACLPDHRTMNPCPVYEKNTKTLFLFFICVLGKTSENHQIHTCKNKARLCYITSSDYGQSWSQVKDLTTSVIGEQVKKWATFAVGPGHGIQIASGRLIVPAYVYYIHCSRCCCFPCSVWPHAVSFYSDDSGCTWRVGKKMQRKSGECEMAEIIDHEGRSYVYCNARSTKGHRVEALSESSGADFNKPNLERSLVEQGHGCQGSVIGFPVSECQGEEHVDASALPSSSDTQTWLLYTHPTNCDKRRDLGVYLNRSPLHQSSWERPWIIHQGPSGYSDLAHCEEKEHFACLMECGEEREFEEIAFVDFHLRDVMEASGLKEKAV